MNEISWWPGVVALLLGLGGGVALARRLGRFGLGAGRREEELRTLELRRDDLAERRDDIYARLRTDDVAEIGPHARQELETAAARVLRDLEEVEARLRAGRAPRVEEKGKRGKKRRKERAARAAGRPAAEPVTAATPESAGGFSARHPLVSGFALGAGMVAVIGVLIFWAMRDTKGSAESAARAPAAGTGEPHEEIGNLPPQVQAEVAALQARLASAPQDVGARKELALLYLNHQQFFAAFQEAKALLLADPRDIDGLFVEAVVRLQIGQADAALERFDEVLELFPDHVQALAWRGVIFYQRGNVSAAVESWERGIQAAGGQHLELEGMVSAALAEEAGLVAAPAPSPSEPRTAAPGSVAGIEDPGAGYPVRITLGGGEAPRVGAVLFVALRAAEGAPPVAVRRIQEPVFPLGVVLTADDSMMGGELPAAGLITARLDADGNLSTEAAEDLEGEAEARLGDPTALVLEP